MGTPWERSLRDIGADRLASQTFREEVQIKIKAGLAAPVPAPDSLLPRFVQWLSSRPPVLAALWRYLDGGLLEIMQVMLRQLLDFFSLSGRA